LAIHDESNLVESPGSRRGSMAASNRRGSMADVAANPGASGSRRGSMLDYEDEDEDEDTTRFRRQQQETAGWRQITELGGWTQERGAELVSHTGAAYPFNESLKQESSVASPLLEGGPFGAFDYIRRMVSQNRLRYKVDGFNLDMRYITPNVIAMGYPAQQSLIERCSRNHIDSIVRFVDLKYEGKVLIMNLVGEANKCVYDFARFPRVCTDCAFLDHGVPTLSQMQIFCQTVDAFLAQDPGNCAMVHCRSGKGRTGVMICAYLLWKYPASFKTAADAMRFYAYRRMHEAMEAIVTPSQRRYVGYFSQRFAAMPGAVRISRVVIPNTHLKISKFRLFISSLRQGSAGGNTAIEEVKWTSKGKGLGVLSDRERQKERERAREGERERVMCVYCLLELVLCVLWRHNSY